MGWPRCQSPVPELDTETLAASPARSTSSVRMTSAIGERQMLPRHTNAIRYGVPVAGGRLLTGSRATTRVEDRVEDHQRDRDHQRGPQCGPEAVDVEAEVDAVRDPAGQQKHERVDDDQHQAQGDHYQG